MPPNKPQPQKGSNVNNSTLDVLVKIAALVALILVIIYLANR